MDGENIFWLLVLLGYIAIFVVITWILWIIYRSGNLITIFGLMYLIFYIPIAGGLLWIFQGCTDIQLRRWKSS